MIKGFRDTWLHNFFKEDTYKKKIPSSIRRRLFRKLQILDDATCDLDLRSPPSNHFEKLSGSLQGKSGIRVNKQWRLIFTWDGERGEANGVYLDNHDYK
ncbi:MAG: type II toxin-antitoxin system RelE/ParE family toxin [Desulfobacterales bacterium]|jgi:proteic killer suppression protein|nr:type II toxin-antitoxin system RelE/ParE family toxin [Desulfobacterales bacterium]